MKHILLIATGGTIASKRTEDGLAPLISSEELLSYVPAAKEFCTTDAIQILNLDSTNVHPEHWLKMAQAVEDNYDKYDGFVICHGTDTMAYTAAALSYLIQNSLKPVVITGAQKPIDMEITDAKANLLDSLRYASCDKAHGVNIVFDGEVIAGTRAKKERTKSYNAFSSINYPSVAIVQDDIVVFYIDDKPAPDTQVKFYHELDSRVFLFKLIPGMDSRILDDIIEKYDAVIIESFGVGGLPHYEEEGGDFHAAIQKWVERGKTVCMATQVTREGSNMNVYEVGHTLKKKFNLLETYDMTLEAAVTKLMWILGQTKDTREVKELFYRTINHDAVFPQR